jgi:hypothetical protein
MNRAQFETCNPLPTTLKRGADSCAAGLFAGRRDCGIPID